MVWTHDSGKALSYPCNGTGIEDYSEKCREVYNVRPSVDSAKITYGEDKFKYASNIVFRYLASFLGLWVLKLFQ